MRREPEQTGQPCRIPGCRGRLLRAIVWKPKIPRPAIGSRQPAGNYVGGNVYCESCGAVYQFAKPPERSRDDEA